MIVSNAFINADCFDVFPEIKPGSIDMIFADLPYNTTACNFDKEKTDLARIWIEYKRLLKPGGLAIFTGTQPFTSLLVTSNLAMFKYSIIWDKVNKYTGSLNANRQPLRRHEDVLVFGGKGSNTYNKQMELRFGNVHGAGHSKGHGEYTVFGKDGPLRARPKTTRVAKEHNPCTILAIPGQQHHKKYLHPTQKPLALIEYLIRTYSNEGETILDSHAGVATTALAALAENRRYIAIEKDLTYFERGQRRLQEAMKCS